MKLKPEEEKARQKIAVETKIRFNLEKLIRKNKWIDNKTNNKINKKNINDMNSIILKENKEINKNIIYNINYNNNNYYNNTQEYITIKIPAAKFFKGNSKKKIDYAVNNINILSKYIYIIFRLYIHDVYVQLNKKEFKYSFLYINGLKKFFETIKIILINFNNKKINQEEKQEEEEDYCYVEENENEENNNNNQVLFNS